MGPPELCYTCGMKTSAQYAGYRKPAWAPPSWVFAPVWTVLYILIAISFGYAAYLYITHAISFIVLLPFLLNLAFNFAFTFLQFRLRNFLLASMDIILVVVTLGIALWAIYPYAPWVAYLNIPYLAWTLFATVLQFTVTALNRAR